MNVCTGSYVYLTNRHTLRYNNLFFLIPVSNAQALYEQAKQQVSLLFNKI
jgi:hypothetical protein